MYHSTEIALLCIVSQAPTVRLRGLFHYTKYGCCPRISITAKTQPIRYFVSTTCILSYNTNILEQLAVTKPVFYMEYCTIFFLRRNGYLSCKIRTFPQKSLIGFNQNCDQDKLIYNCCDKLIDILVYSPVI